MIDPELAAKLEEIRALAEAAARSAERARKYLFWTGVVTVALIVIPLIGLVFVIPSFISNYLGPIQAQTSTLHSLGY